MTTTTYPWLHLRDDGIYEVDLHGAKGAEFKRRLTIGGEFNAAVEKERALRAGGAAAGTA